MVIANKVDQKNRRVVNTKKGEEYAKSLGLTYFECSAVML